MGVTVTVWGYCGEVVGAAAFTSRLEVHQRSGERDRDGRGSAAGALGQ